MGRRIEYWKEKGYTDIQIQNHLSYEKSQRDLRKKYEDETKEEYKEQIEYVKKNLKKTGFRFRNVTTDGRGFYIEKVLENPTTKRKTYTYYIEWEFYNYLDFYIKRN